IGPGFLRLKIGDLQYADLALPLGVTAGSKQVVKYASSNVEVSAELNAVEINVPGETVAPVPTAERLTGAAPRVAISDFAELSESPSDGLAPASTPGSGRVDAAAKLQELPTAPVAVSGRLSSPGEEDMYLLAVK